MTARTFEHPFRQRHLLPVSTLAACLGCISRVNFNQSLISVFSFIRQLIEKISPCVKAPKYFPSTQLCSVCGYKNETLKDMKVRNYVCPVCGTFHNRDKNACANLIAWHKTKNIADAASVYACGDDVRLHDSYDAVVCEAGKVGRQDLSSRSLQGAVC